jgi:hypothetical protein
MIALPTAGTYRRGQRTPVVYDIVSFQCQGRLMTAMDGTWVKKADNMSFCCFGQLWEGLERSDTHTLVAAGA